MEVVINADVLFNRLGYAAPRFGAITDDLWAPSTSGTCMRYDGLSEEERHALLEKFSKQFPHWYGEMDVSHNFYLIMRVIEQLLNTPNGKVRLIGLIPSFVSDVGLTMSQWKLNLKHRLGNELYRRLNVTLLTEPKLLKNHLHADSIILDSFSDLHYGLDDRNFTFADYIEKDFPVFQLKGHCDEDYFITSCIKETYLKSKEKAMTS